MENEKEEKEQSIAKLTELYKKFFPQIQQNSNRISEKMIPEMNAFCDRMKEITSINQKSYRNREEEFSVILGQTSSVNSLIQEIYKEIKENNEEKFLKEIQSLDKKMEVLEKLKAKYV